MLASKSNVIYPAGDRSGHSSRLATQVPPDKGLGLVVPKGFCWRWGRCLRVHVQVFPGRFRGFAIGPFSGRTGVWVSQDRPKRPLAHGRGLLFAHSHECTRVKGGAQPCGSEFSGLYNSNRDKSHEANSSFCFGREAALSKHGMGGEVQLAVLRSDRAPEEQPQLCKRICTD